MSEEREKEWGKEHDKGQEIDRVKEHEAYITQSPETELNHLLNHCVRYLRHHPSGPIQMAVVRLLKANGPMSQQDIQTAMDVKPGTISEMLSKLEKKGLIEKTRQDDDRRKALITLTEEGEKLSPTDTSDSLHERYEALTPEEIDEMIVLLRKLLDSWEKEDKMK